jgi:hypothetical protein
VQIAPALPLQTTAPLASPRCTCESDPATDAPPPAPVAPAPAPVAPEAPRTDDSGITADGGARARGLLDKLEAGHFSPVADLRLRINFHEELAARAEQRVEDAINEQAPALNAAVESGLADVLAAAGATEEDRAAAAELLSQFQTSLDSTLDESDARVTTADLRDQLSTSFDSFLDQLRDLLAPDEVPPPDHADPIEGDPAAPVPAAPVDDTAPVAQAVAQAPISDADPSVPPAEPVDPVETSALDDAIASLASAFAAALDSLMTSIADAGALPEPVAPSNSGRAFAKFLAQYQALTASAGADDLEALA